jgi:hypothetical protein
MCYVGEDYRTHVAYLLQLYANQSEVRLYELFPAYTNYINYGFL